MEACKNGNEQNNYNQEEKPIVYFHGFHSFVKNPFTYRCGKCFMPINETGEKCKYCNTLINWRN